MVLQELNVRIGLLLDEFQKNAAKAKEEATGLKKTFDEMKGALIGFGVGAFLKDTIAEFADAERNTSLLSMRIKSLGGDWQGMTKEVLDYIDASSEAAKIDDDELKPAMSSLIDATKDARVSMSLLQDVMDIHVATGMDLKRASELVGRAYNGERGELMELGKQFGVSQHNATSFKVVMEAVRAQTQGAATGTKDLKAGLDRISVSFGNFKEEVGHIFSGGGIWTGFVAGILDATTKGMKILNSFQDHLRQLWSNMGSIFKKGFKSTHEEAKSIFEDFVTDTYQILKGGEEKKSKVIRTEIGKQQKWMNDQAKNDLKRRQKEVSDSIKAADLEMQTRVALGQATNQQLFELMKQHAAQMKEVYGEQSKEYQQYYQGLLQQTQQTYSDMYTAAQGTMNGISAGFEAAFTAIAKDGADASQAMEAFARAMGRSLLNSIASGIDGLIIQGTSGYLTNMLIGGPWMAAPTSAYSLPLLAALAATSGMIHGLAAMMAEGGTLTKPGLVMMAEKPTGEPETAIPLSRMDEVFTKYSQYLGKKGRGGGGNTIIVQRVVDNRGAGVVAANQFEQAKSAKAIGDVLVRRGIIKNPRGR